MKNFVQFGQSITVTAPANVTSGALVVVGGLAGVASISQVSGQKVDIEVEGVFDLPKISAESIAAGDRLYWNASEGKLTKTPGTDGKLFIGFALQAAGSGVTNARCRLTPTGITGPTA